MRVLLLYRHFTCVIILKKGGAMLVFNPYDLTHIAMMDDWLNDKKRGVIRPCPFLNSEQVEKLTKRKMKTKRIKAGIFKQKN